MPRIHAAIGRNIGWTSARRSTSARAPPPHIDSAAQPGCCRHNGMRRQGAKLQAAANTPSSIELPAATRTPMMPPAASGTVAQPISAMMKRGLTRTRATSPPAGAARRVRSTDRSARKTHGIVATSHPRRLACTMDNHVLIKAPPPTEKARTMKVLSGRESVDPSHRVLMRMYSPYAIGLPVIRGHCLEEVCAQGQCLAIEWGRSFDGHHAVQLTPGIIAPRGNAG